MSGFIDLIIDKFKKLAEYFSLVEEVYVEKKDGEVSVVNSKYEEELNKTIQELKKSLYDVYQSVDDSEKNMILEVNSSFDRIKDSLLKGSMDISKARDLVTTATKELEESKSININEQKNTKTGGDFRTVTYKDENDEKRVGGVIVSKNGEISDNIGGKYIALDKALEIIQNLTNEFEKNSDVSELDRAKQDIKNTIRAESDKIAETCQISAEGLPDKINSKKLSAKKDYKGVKRIINALVAAGWAFTLFSKKVDYRVSTMDDTIRETENLENLENELGEALDDIDKMKMVDFNRLNEVYATGNDEKYGIQYQNAEVLSRDDGMEFSNRRAELEKAKEDAINRFNSKTSHTNAERLAFEMELLSISKEVIELQNEANTKTIEYSADWISLNDEHIASGELFEEALKGHEAENMGSEDLIKNEEKATNENVEEIKYIERKIATYEKISQLKNVEKIGNIEDVTETLFTFLESDLGKKIGLENLFKYIGDKNIELFSSYTEYAQVKDDVDKFMDGFELLDNTFNAYVSEYCEGDSSKVSTDQYVQYFEEAQHNEENIGEQGFFKTKMAMIEQNNLNRNFYEQKGKEVTGTEIKTGLWNRFVQNISTIFDGQRAGRYNEVINEIEKDRNININERKTMDNADVELNDDER